MTVVLKRENCVCLGIKIEDDIIQRLNIDSKEEEVCAMQDIEDIFIQD